MPPKKSSNKKQTKVVASSLDANLSNNGEKEVAEELAIEAKSLPNGSSSVNEVDEPKESMKSKAAKRSSGRTKNVAPELETEAPPSKKPAVKGRGKKKSTENEVIENGTEAQAENQETNEITTEENQEEATTKPKGRGGGGGKKEEAKIKKSAKAKEDNTLIGRDDETKEAEEDKMPEKKKSAGGRKKKPVTVTKAEEEDEVEIKPEVKEELIEKVSKKTSRNSKKEEIPVEIEPAKKKGRAAKKEKPLEDDVEVTVFEAEVKTEFKEKKTTKRGRGAAKALEEAPATSGDNEEVLPKKRSRKAPSAEKEIVLEKPKRGRGKKTEKAVEKVPEESASLEGKEEEENEQAETANAKDKHEKTGELEESLSLNKRAEKQPEPASAPALTVATKTKGGRKRAAPSTNKKKSAKTTADDEELDDGVDNTEMEDEADGSKPNKSKKNKTDAAPVNATATNYNKADFELPPPPEGETVEEPRFNLKISSWNVAGLRSWLKKEGLKYLEYEQPDIFCMQETKCTNDQLPEEVTRIPGYHPYWLCMPGGYAGVAIYSKIMPINVEYGIGNKEFDDCGRIITAEYEKFFLINVYVPNSGRKLVNLDARMKWEKLFQEFVQNLDARKPVVICGDMNVSHKEHDLANPKTNTRNAGFTKEERDKMSELLALGYIDTFRHLYPDRKGAYTYWTYMANARSRNVGWRLDYFIVSERFIKRVVDNCIRSQCMGSDHCPITLFLKL